MYSKPHPSERLKQIFKDNLYRINNYTKIHDGKKINYQEKLKEILNDKNKYALLIERVIANRREFPGLPIFVCFREAMRESILDYTDNIDGGKSLMDGGKYLKSYYKPIHNFSICISTMQHISSQRDKKYTDKLHDEIEKYIDDEINNHCDNKILFDHKKGNIAKTVNTYTSKYSPVLFPRPLEKVIESFVDNGCPLTMSNQ